MADQSRWEERKSLLVIVAIVTVLLLATSGVENVVLRFAIFFGACAVAALAIRWISRRHRS